MNANLIKSRHFLRRETGNKTYRPKTKLFRLKPKIIDYLTDYLIVSKIDITRR